MIGLQNDNTEPKQPSWCHGDQEGKEGEAGIGPVKEFSRRKPRFSPGMAPPTPLLCLHLAPAFFRAHAVSQLS